MTAGSSLLDLSLVHEAGPEGDTGWRWGLACGRGSKPQLPGSDVK